MYDEVDHLPPEDRKEYIEGVVDRINVGLDPKTKEHVIDIKFKYPTVGDRHEYIDPSKKSKGYEHTNTALISNILGGQFIQMVILKLLLGNMSQQIGAGRWMSMR